MLLQSPWCPGDGIDLLLGIRWEIHLLWTRGDWKSIQMSAPHHEVAADTLHRPQRVPCSHRLLLLPSHLGKSTWCKSCCPTALPNGLRQKWAGCLWSSSPYTALQRGNSPLLGRCIRQVHAHLRIAACGHHQHSRSVHPASRIHNPRAIKF